MVSSSLFSYTVDLAAGTQRNTKTGKVRQIRRLPTQPVRKAPTKRPGGVSEKLKVKKTITKAAVKGRATKAAKLGRPKAATAGKSVKPKSKAKPMKLSKPKVCSIASGPRAKSLVWCGKKTKTSTGLKKDHACCVLQMRVLPPPIPGICFLCRRACLLHGPLPYFPFGHFGGCAPASHCGRCTVLSGVVPRRFQDCGCIVVFLVFPKRIVHSSGPVAVLALFKPLCPCFNHEHSPYYPCVRHVFQEDMTKNKFGRLVSKRRSAAGRTAFGRVSRWIAACKQARAELGITGFVAITKGSELCLGNLESGWEPPTRPAPKKRKGLGAPPRPPRFQRQKLVDCIVVGLMLACWTLSTLVFSPFLFMLWVRGVRVSWRTARQKVGKNQFLFPSWGFSIVCTLMLLACLRFSVNASMSLAWLPAWM